MASYGVDFPYVTDYRAVAASQTDSVLGFVGKQGDILERLIIVPAAATPGAVSIKDGSGGSAITVFTGGATITTTTPVVIDIGARATTAANGGWRVTTGASVSVVAVGRFT